MPSLIFLMSCHKGYSKTGEQIIHTSLIICEPSLPITTLYLNNQLLLYLVSYSFILMYELTYIIPIYAFTHPFKFHNSILF